jgi:signal transduction histidine kinase/CheY-like chemotaxis protein
MNMALIDSLPGNLRFHIDEGNLRLRADQLRARLKMYPTMVAGQMLLEPLFVALFWGQCNHEALLSWLAVMFALHAVEIFGWSRYKDQLQSVEQCRQWNTRFILYALAVGLAWGSVALWFFPQDLAYQALLICVVLGLAAGAVTMNAVHPPSLYVYVLCVTLPLLLRLALGSNAEHWILASMLLLFLLTVVSAGRELSQTFWTALLRRDENDSLIRQLTEQKARAETASRDKSRFLAAASHDLRQPLQALVLFSEALQDMAREKNTAHLAGQIGKSVSALVDMFDELLDVSRLDAGVVQAHRQHFELRNLFDRLYVDFAHQAHAKGVLLEMPDCEQVVYSDPGLLERILRNLVSNAIRYTSAGKVQVLCECSPSQLTLSVKDSGVGISAENLPHIFEEYYQVSNPQRDRRLGLGLGLAIVRRMEALLGCKVEVQSEPGKGSVFSFSVSLGEAAQSSPPFVLGNLQLDLHGVNVVLVEDDPDIRHSLSELMEHWGCQVVAGEQAAEVNGRMRASGRRPDILVCDYRLPQGVTALDVINQVHEVWGEGVPALVLTGDTEPQTLLEIQKSGAQLLHKPIAPARLRSVMHAALHGECRAQ